MQEERCRHFVEAGARRDPAQSRSYGKEAIDRPPTFPTTRQTHMPTEFNTQNQVTVMTGMAQDRHKPCL